MAAQLQSINDKNGALLSFLFHRNDIDVNCLDKYGQSALMILLMNQQTRPEFSSSSEELDVVKMFLSHRADPNVPARLLAWAVNSAFPNTEFFPDQHGGREAALHCAIRHKSWNKIQLHGTKFNCF